MADSAIEKLIPLAIIGGLGYWAYLTFFATPATLAATPPATGPGTNPQPNTTIPPVNTTPPAPPPPSGPCPKTGVLASILKYAQQAQGDTAGTQFGDGLPGTLTMDQWCYYADQDCTGICLENDITPDHFYPGDPNRGGPINWSKFKGWATQAGLSGLGTHAVRRIA